VILTSYFAYSLIRNRSLRKQEAKNNSATGGDGTDAKEREVETIDGRAEMSGGLDSIASVGSSSRHTISRGALDSVASAGSSSRHTISRGASSIGEIIEPEPEPEPVEIGSSGYGKMMSEAEKALAVEVEANERIRFEERKKRRRRVLLEIKRLKILL
jgi:hypothetical protein